MGSVWRACRLSDQRECALKIFHRVPPERVLYTSDRFLREVKAAAAIDSPHAVQLYDYGIHDGTPFIAMELLVGETLASRLRICTRLSPSGTSLIIGQIADALRRAHELGIIHRDLKPDNVFLARTPTLTTAKVLDFGIAKVHDEEMLAGDLTETGALLGTLHYMSPEQIDGARYVDHRADLWSLAVIAFECITGVRPFKGEGLRSLVSSICLQPPPVPSALGSVPAGFDAWFAKTTHRDSTMRFQSAGELADELHRVCDPNASSGIEEPLIIGGDDSHVQPDSKLQSGLFLGAHASSKMDYLNIRHLDSEQCLVWYRNVQMVLSLQAPSYAFMRRIMEGLKELAAACGSAVGALVVVRSEARPPSEEAREYMARELAQISMIAAAQVIEGDGFRGAAMRSVLSLLQLAARPRYPMKVFGDMTSAATWLAAELQKKTANAPQGADLARAANEVRRRFLNGSMPSFASTDNRVSGT